MRVLVLLLFLGVAPCWAASFPTLDTGTFSGSVAEGTLHVSVALRLHPDHLFILQETSSAEGRRPHTQTLTGHWYQVGGGSLIQLSNRNGYLRTLNVGGTGNLYLGVQAPFSRYQNVALKPDTLPDVPFALSGVLAFAPDGVALTDSATGHGRKVAPGDAVEHLKAHGGQPLFIEAEVSEMGEQLVLERVLSATVTLPPLPVDEPFDFQRAVKGVRWKDADAAKAVQFEFRPDAETGGTLVVTVAAETVSLPYSLTKEGIRFQKTGRERPLTALASMHAWTLRGDLLVFSGPDKTLCVLEKIR